MPLVHRARYTSRVDGAIRWVLEHPASAAWAVFGVLSALVAAYRSQEAKIRAYVAKTPNKADDRLVRALDTVVAVFDVLRLFVPHVLGRPAPQLEEKPEAKPDA